jgi:chorismate mutase
MDALEHWRKKIDELDIQLVHVLNQRAEYAQEIGKIKIELGLDAYSPQREEEVMVNVLSHNAGPLSPHAIRRLFERIIDESRAAERIAMENVHRNPSDPTA